MRYDDYTQELRLQALERRMQAVEDTLHELVPRTQPAPAAPPVPAPPVVPPAEPVSSPAAPVLPSPPPVAAMHPPAPPRVPPRAVPRVTLPPRPQLDLEQLLGGRVFAWIGGIAILVGIAFFVATAMQRGWIPPSVRIGLAFVGSAALLGVGVWLHEQREQTQASLLAIGTAIAALYASLVGATSLYHLIHPALGLAVALLIGATATTIAVRFDSVHVAGLGILGALVAPVTVDAGPGWSALIFMGIALAASTGVLVWRRWDWLALLAYVASAPQLAVWMLDHPSDHVVLGVAALVVFWAIYVVAALGYELRVPAAELRASSAMLAVSNVIFTTGLGWLLLDRTGHGDAATTWVIAMAGLHVALGALAALRMRDGREIPLLLVACGVSLSAIGLALALDGPWLVAGWAVEGALLAWISSRLASVRALVGSFAFLALAAGIALHIALPLEGYTSSVDAQQRIAALLIVAAAALVAAFCLRANPWQDVLPELVEEAAALFVLLALPIALDGSWLVAGLALGATVLAGLAGRFERRSAGLGALEWGTVGLVLALHIAVPEDGYATDVELGRRLAALLVVAAAALLSAYLVRSSRWVLAVDYLEALAAGLVLLALPIVLDGVWLEVAVVGGSLALVAVAARWSHVVALGAATVWACVAVVLAARIAVPEDVLYGSSVDAESRIAALLVLAGAALLAALLLRRCLWGRWTTEPLEAAAAGLLLAALPIALDGTPLVAALAAGALALAALGGRFEHRIAGAAGGVWSLVALGHVLLYEATPRQALLHGVSASHALALACATAGVVGAVVLARNALGLSGADRTPLGIAGGIVLLYGLSGLVVAAVPSVGGATDGKSLALSAFWSLVGVALFVAGLARDKRPVRLGAIALLTLAIAKVFLYDLASLGSLTRVASFIALGIVLLAAAYAYQRQAARSR
jgi:uncharacterized membrane protein